MRSETPKDRADDSQNEGSSRQHDEESRSSSAAVAAEMLGGGDDGSTDELLGTDGGPEGPLLLGSERKLPKAEQMRLIAMRRHHGDGIDEDDTIGMSGGRRRRGRRGNDDGNHPHGHGGGRDGRPGRGGPSKGDGDTDATDTSGGNAKDKRDKDGEASGNTGTAGGTRIEKDADAQTRTAATGERSPASTETRAARLDDPAHPQRPLYDAALKAVATLDPAQAPMTTQEQSNVAGALTARMAGDPGFARHVADPSQVSFGLGQNGERLFAINHAVPDAPSAVHVSVDLAQARQQPLEASSVALAQAVEAQVQVQQHVQAHDPPVQPPEHAPHRLA